MKRIKASAIGRNLIWLSVCGALLGGCSGSPQPQPSPIFPIAPAPSSPASGQEPDSATTISLPNDGSNPVGDIVPSKLS